MTSAGSVVSGRFCQSSEANSSDGRITVRSTLTKLWREFAAGHRTNRRSGRRGNAGQLAETLETRALLTELFHPGQVILSATSAEVSENVTGSYPGATVQPLGNYGLYLLKLPASLSVQTAVTELRNFPGVQFAEPDWYAEREQLPNDPRFPEQWGLNNIGQTIQGVNGTPGADIAVVNPWDNFQGANTITVAIIDDGIDIDHQDLQSNIWRNTAEVAGNGIDDDNNGYIDDINGWDFGDGDNDPRPDAGDFHGTHVAGIVGAIGNNGIGVSGVNWNVQLMPVKIFGANISISGIIAGLNYAVNNGALVSNNSYNTGTGGPSLAFQAALNFARTRGHVFVSSAGNTAQNNDLINHYPSDYPQDNVVAVAATDNTDTRASFSNIGATSVDIGAPGVSILSTVTGNSYAYLDGTSMASPHVAGAVAYLMAMRSDLTYQQILSYMYQNVDPLPSLAGVTVSGGRLNLEKTIAALPPARIASLSLSSSAIQENAGSSATTLTVTRVAFPFDQPLTVAVTVLDTTEAQLGGGASSTITIPAFRRTVTVPIDAVDDTLLDGTQSVAITVDYLGVEQDRVILDVLDHETISVLATPDIVFEDAGANAGTLTITRSNTDIFSPDRIVAVNNSLRFFDRQGQLKSTVTVPWPTGFRPANQSVRDVAVMEDGKIAVFNGTSTVYISIYNPGNGTWAHQLINNASASAADSGTGGLSTIGSFVFISDLESTTGDPWGLVRYDVNSGQIDRFGTKAFGPRLFGSTWPESDVYELEARQRR